MARSLALAVSVASLVALGQAAFAPNHYTLNYPETVKNIIVESAETTLVVPKKPTPAVDNLGVWPGMLTYKGADHDQVLIQAVTIAAASPNNQCGGKAGQWCVNTLSTGLSSGDPIIDGRKTPVNPNDHVKIVYTRDGAKYKQVMSKDGKVLSEQNTNSSGAANSWWTAIECQGQFDGTLAAHQWLDTTITLSEKRMDFANSLTTDGVSASKLYTTDGGKTWKIDHIDVSATKCDASSDEDGSDVLPVWPA